MTIVRRLADWISRPFRRADDRVRDAMRKLRYRYIMLDAEEVMAIGDVGARMKAEIAKLPPATLLRIRDRLRQGEDTRSVAMAENIPVIAVRFLRMHWIRNARRRLASLEKLQQVPPDKRTAAPTRTKSTGAAQ